MKILCLLMSFLFASSFSNDLITKNSSLETNGNDFKIIGFTDMHFGGGNPSDRVLKIVRNIVSLHKPNLVVFTGDQANQADGIESLELISQALTEFKTPWVMVFGNHDRDAGLSTENALLESYDEYCLYQDGSLKWDDIQDDGTGVRGEFEKHGDYSIDITDDGKPIYSLVLMDSGPYPTGYIESYQVGWYENLMVQKAIDTYGRFDPATNRVVPSLVFMHQGLPEHQMAADYVLGAKDSLGPVPEEFGFGEIARNHHLQREDVNFGLFAAAKRVNGTHFFCGHDHYNNANMLYEGIQLTFFNKISQNNQEVFSEARTSFATQIVLTKKDGCEERPDFSGWCWGVALSYALPNGSTTRDCYAWRNFVLSENSSSENALSNETAPVQDKPPVQTTRASTIVLIVVVAVTASMLAVVVIAVIIIVAVVRKRRHGRGFAIMH